MFGKTLNIYVFRTLSSLIIAAKSDTRNIEYVIGWLNEISLEMLLFE